MDGCPANEAAGVTVGHNYGGYTDWFLPSQDELDALYDAKDVVGGFASGSYWSSSEYSSNYAWYQYFDDGNQSNYDGKGSTLRVRAVRAF